MNCDEFWRCGPCRHVWAARKLIDPAGRPEPPQLETPDRPCTKPGRRVRRRNRAKYYRQVLKEACVEAQKAKKQTRREREQAL